MKLRGTELRLGQACQARVGQAHGSGGGRFFKEPWKATHNATRQLTTYTLSGDSVRGVVSVVEYFQFSNYIEAHIKLLSLIHI